MDILALNWLEYVQKDFSDIQYSQIHENKVTNMILVYYMFQVFRIIFQNNWMKSPTAGPLNIWSEN